MQLNIKLLDAVSAPGPGAAFGGSGVISPFYERRPKTGSFIITGTATVTLDGSHDSATWYTIISATATGSYTDIPPYLYYRGNLQSIGSGTVTLTVGD